MMDLKNERIWKQKEEEYRWLADEEEVKKARIALSSAPGGSHYVSMLTSPGLKHMIMELHRYPSRYVKAIRIIIDTHDSLHKQE
jgi:hypothetical protein